MGGALSLPATLMPNFPWHPSVQDQVTKLLMQVTPTLKTPLQQQLVQEAGDRVEKMLAGIKAYHQHPYYRDLEEPPVLTRIGSSRLLDYGATGGKKAKSQPVVPRPVVLCVPSLINPAYILDLNQQSSLMRSLAADGFRPLLIDWGTPDAEERTFTLADYITGRLASLLEAAVQQAGGPVHLMGYCMGGNLAVALAALHPSLIRSMALLATPWDFHVTSVTQSRAISTIMSGMIKLCEATGEVPVDLIQIFFSSLDPTLSDRKFRRFADMNPNTDQARLFVAIEDWSNSGAPLPYKVACECLYEWYGNNSPAKGEWQIDGKIIDPAQIHIPALVVIPSTDRIVPPASARALGEILPQAAILEAQSGHVTMIVSPSARNSLWKPLGNWFRNTHI